MNSISILVVLVLTSILILCLALYSGFTSQTLDSKARLPFELMREAYLASKTSLVSGSGVGIYEQYTQKPGGTAKSLRIRADVKVWFDNNKYHIELLYKNNPTRVRSTKIICDGEVLMKTEEYIAPASKKSLTRTELFAADALRTSPDRAGFPFNPGKLPDAVFYIGKKLDRFAHEMNISVVGADGYVGRCPYDKDRMEFDFSSRIGYNVSSSRIYNEGQTRAVAESHAEWSRSDRIWFIKSIRNFFHPSTSSAIEDALTYLHFQPNASVDNSLFRVSALQMTPNSAIIDRRPNAPHRMYRNQPLHGTTDSELDRMAEYIKSLPARDPKGNRTTPFPIRFWFLLGGSILIGFGFFWMLWRRWFSRNPNGK